MPAWAQIGATALPTGGVVAAGNAAISQAGNSLRIDQSSNKAIIDWQSFNIGRDASVRFNQPSASAITLNRVGADGGRSIIDGGLSANGQVWLLNPGGVLFGAAARVDVGGLLAGSLQLGNEDFLNGNYRFHKDGNASVVNQGHLAAADGGYIALLAPEVRNEGVIAARLGTVALASGDELRVDFSGDRLIEIKVDQAAVSGLIDNKNLVEAEGGWVLMCAGAAGDLAAGAINTTGIVRATAFPGHESGIQLTGGFVALGGSLSADGANTNGGTITVTASRDLSLADSVSARGLSGGAIDYRVGGRVIETATSHTDVSGQQDGGSIHVVADGGILSSGRYSATGADGQGGRIDLSGASVRLLSATLDASGNTQGGLVRVGGPFQGGKAQDTTSENFQRYSGRFGSLPELPHAQRSFINDSSQINVSAKSGDGGTAVVWSDSQTTFLGQIKAKGGAVEVSSAGDLRYVNLAGLELGTGFLLLDPKDIVIGDFSSAETWTYQAILGKGYAGSDVTGLESGDAFGISVALNSTGDRLAVGAYTDGGFGNASLNSGAVYLYSFAAGNFANASLSAMIGSGYIGGKNLSVSLATNESFGSSVALNGAGDRLAAGAAGNKGSANAGSSRGAAYLFSFTDQSFSGGQLESIVGSGYTGGKNVNLTLSNNDGVGYGIALNATGSRLALGSTAQKAFLLNFNDASFSGGTLSRTIAPSDAGTSGGFFGESVALNGTGDRLAVGQTFGNAAYLFSFSDTTGPFTGMLYVNSISKSDRYFSNQLSLSQDAKQLLVGAPGANGSRGAAYLYTFSDGNWSSPTLHSSFGQGFVGQYDASVSLDANDNFGRAVAISGNGNRIAIGAWNDAGSSNSSGSGTGATYLFSSNLSSNVTFSSSPSATVNIDRTGLQTLLSAGTSVTLQANNDITLNSGSDLIVNNPSGNGGALTLQAGRSVLLNSNVTTDSGMLTVGGSSYSC